jgi:PAS domain S-box-containing protein
MKNKKRGKTENLNEIILNSVNEYVRVVDRKYNVVYENTPMQEHLGITKGKKCFEFWKEKEPCKDCVSALVRENCLERIREVEIDNKHFKVKCYPIILSDGSCEKTVEIIADITEQKKLNKKIEGYTEKLEEEVEKKTSQIRKNQEIILKERENLTSILDSMQDIVFVINKDYNIRFINRTSWEKFGNVIGKKCYNIIHDSPVPCLKCKTSQVIDDKENTRWEHYSKKDGCYYDIIESPTIGPDSEPSALIIMRNITELKQMENQLRSSEERYYLAQQAANLGSWDLNIKANSLHWSEQVEPIFGFEKGQFKGTYEAFLECVHPEDRKMVTDSVNSCINENTDYSVEHRIIWPNGTIRWVAESGNVLRDKDSIAYRMLGIVTDITRRKQFEEKLRLNEARLETLLKLNNMTEATDDEISSFALEKGVSLTGSQIGYMHFINDDQKSLNLYAWSKETLKYCEAEKTPHYPLDLAGVWVDCFRQKRAVIHNNYQNLDKKKGYPKGHVHLIRHMSIPVFDNNKVVAVAGVGNKKSNYDDSDVRQLSLLINGMWEHIRHRRNVEAIKKHSFSLEEQVQKLVEEVRVKDKLAILGVISAGLAHEIRNPMGSIIAGINLLDRDDKSDEDKKVVYDILKKETERINRSLTEFLTYARPNKFTTDNVNINTILEDIIKLAAKNPDLSAEHNIVSELNPAIIDIPADIDRVKQVFWNILSNGFKAMNKPGTIKIKTFMNTRYLSVEISDTGSGISKENLEKIFNPFFTMSSGGTGLGLAISQRIMEEHHGKIKAKSEINKGSVFTLSFPLKKKR